MGRPPTWTRDQIIAALDGATSVRTVARDLGCSAHAIYARARRDPAIRAALDTVCERPGQGKRRPGTVSTAQ